MQLYEQFAHMGEPSDRSSRLVSAVTWLRHLAHLKQSTWKKDCLEMVRAGDVEHERRTNPKATTRPPCSLTTDFLHPGQSLSSSGTRSAAPLRRSMCECSRRGTSWGAAASIAGRLGQPEICAGMRRRGKIKRNCHAVTAFLFMALITVAGFPAAGKSSRAVQLAAYLRARIASPDYEGPIANVALISDESLGLTRACYDGTVPNLYTLFRSSFSQKASSKSLPGARSLQPSSGSFRQTRSLLLTRSTTLKASATRSTVPLAK